MRKTNLLLSLVWHRKLCVCPERLRQCLPVCLPCLSALCQVFLPAQARGAGWAVSRVCQLDDVPYGTSFSSILLHKYQLSNQRQWGILSLVPLR